MKKKDIDKIQEYYINILPDDVNKVISEDAKSIKDTLEKEIDELKVETSDLIKDIDFDSLSFSV